MSGTDFSIFNIFTMLGGLAFFLYGMNVMSTGLEKLTGGKLEIALKKMTSNKFMAIILGMMVTIAIQSSSAMTVMLVGFVNSGIMSLEQTIGVCFGSDIGTTLTAWILSLAGVDGKNPFIKMLKPSSFAPLVALVGVILIERNRADGLMICLIIVDVFWFLVAHEEVEGMLVNEVHSELDWVDTKRSDDRILVFHALRAFGRFLE